LAEPPIRDGERPGFADASFIGLDEMARRLGVSSRTVRRMVDRGELPKPCLSTGGRPRWLWNYIVEFCRKRHERDSTVGRRFKNKLN
jgi:excisionase family DNA binding protein